MNKLLLSLFLFCSTLLAQAKLPAGLLPLMETPVQFLPVERPLPALCAGCRMAVEISTSTGDDSNTPGFFEAKRTLGGFTVTVIGWAGSGVCLGERPDCYVYAPCTVSSVLVIGLTGAPPGTAVTAFWGTTPVGTVGSGGILNLPISFTAWGDTYTVVPCGSTVPLTIVTADMSASTSVGFQCTACQ